MKTDSMVKKREGAGGTLALPPTAPTAPTAWRNVRLSTGSLDHIETRGPFFTGDAYR
jgi:hypothetical protein